MTDTMLGSNGLMRVTASSPDSHPPRRRDDRAGRDRSDGDAHGHGYQTEEDGGRTGRRFVAPILDLATARERAKALEAELEAGSSDTARERLAAIADLLSVLHLIAGTMAARGEAAEAADVGRRAEDAASKAPAAASEARADIDRLTGPGPAWDVSFTGLRRLVTSVILKTRAIAAEAARAGHDADHPGVAVALRSVAHDLAEIAIDLERAVKDGAPVATYGRNGVASTVAEPQTAGPRILSEEV